MNSKDPIEKLFKENQHGFDEAPRPALWERIESKLEEREERACGIILWWKYVAAAVVVFLLSWSLYFITNSSEKQTPQSINVVLQPIEKSKDSYEINAENKSKILDQIELEQPAVAFENNQSKNKEITPSQETEFQAPKAFYEKEVFSEEEASHKEIEIPQEIDAKINPPIAQKLSSSSTVIDVEVLETRRMGNSNFNAPTDYSVLIEPKVIVLIEDETYVYELISKEKDSFILKNTEVKFPQEVKLIQKNDTISLDFSGKKSKKNSKKSKKIQQYFEQKKSEIYQQISDPK